MKRQPDPSDGPTAAFILGQVLAIGTALFLFADGAQAVRHLYGMPIEPGDETRRVVLAGLGLAYFYRQHLALGPLRWRPMTWDGARKAFVSAMFLQAGFAWLGAGAGAPVGGPRDEAGLALFVAGTFWSAWIDLIRARAFHATDGRCALCTQGPFAVARHPELLGDLMWGLGWALLTRSEWALLVPVAAAVAFMITSAAEAEHYLEMQERSSYRDWASRTKRFIPFLY